MFPQSYLGIEMKFLTPGSEASTVDRENLRYDSKEYVDWL